MSARPLEPAGDDLRALLAVAADYVVSYVDRLPSEPASDVGGLAEFLADPALRTPPPEEGRPFADLLALVDRAASKGFNPASAGYLAFIPGSGIVASAIADLLADVLNRYTGMAFPAPGLVALEHDVVSWMVGLFGLPPGAAGILTTGGSLAAFSGLVTARSERLHEDFLAGTLYVTAHAHQSVVKAARLAGFPPSSVRVVPVDADLRMDVAALRSLVAADRAAGRVPFCVVANAGSTDTGTVDPLPAIADVARDEGLWLHVDAAYGGFFQLTSRGRERLAGIERADSLVLDPHKGLFLPFGTGALLVRDGEALRRAHSGDAGHYLRDLGETGLPNYGDYSPELTRDFRGLRVWLPLHLHGVAAFRDALDEKLDLAAYAYDVLAATAGVTVPWRPDLSTVAFHCGTDDVTNAVLDAVNAEGRVRLSSTSIAGRVHARVSILNHRTDRARVDEALDAIRRHAAACTELAGWAGHVARFRDELDATDDAPPGLWHEYDWVAALLIRDRVEAALPAASPEQRAAVAAADETFRAFTREDDERLLDAVTGERGEGWWWSRVPVRGPVAEGLRQRQSRQ